ncbi:MAG: hypothetical protein Kow0074_08360 [Candidatus Zixiibacteriota bacterium]
MGRRAWIAMVATAVITGWSSPVFAEDSTSTDQDVPEVSAYRINPHAPEIDGDLRDEVWQSPDIERITQFTQRDPDDGAPASESTVVAVLYDDDALYIGFWCYDSEPDKIARQLVRRDRIGESDWVDVLIDPYHDHQTGNEFAVTAAGTLQDIRIYNDDWSDDSWDAVWDAQVKMQPWGWSAEYRIPYHCLRFTEKDSHTWGINFLRHINRKSETVWWSYFPRSKSGMMSNNGHLKNLQGILPARHVEVMPYVVSKAEVTPKTPGNADGKKYPSNVGVDVKYGVSSNLTLDATVNPDFGQVELDQPVLNLSAFETWFDEKRPFFMENNDLFQTPFTLFYSRRIGRAPRGGVDDDEFDYTVERPQATSILGAAKLTGKLESGTSIGVVSALTEEEKEQYRTVNGALRNHVIEPTASYNVIRVKQDVMDKSSVGGILTIASQDERHPSTTGGVDWRLFTPGGGWEFSGQVVASRVDNQSTGFGWLAEFSKRSGKHWRGEIGATIKDPNLNISHMGFTPRSDLRHTYAWIQYRTQDDWWIIRNTWNNLNLYSDWNYNGDDIGRGGNVNFSIEFINNWWLSGGVEMQAAKYDDFETRGNGLWEWPDNPSYAWWASLGTDERKPVSINVNPGSGGDRGGSWWANWVGVQLRPKSNIQIEAGANYHRTFNATRWVANIEDNAIFADLDKDEVFMELTASVMLSRNLSWQISGQGLISSLDYADYKRYLGGNSYARDVDPLDRDGTFSSLNTMMIMRYEYRPGSTIYFVWTRSRPEFDSNMNQLSMRNEFDRFFSRGSENVWLLKMSYWWNP